MAACGSTHTDSVKTETPPTPLLRFKQTSVSNIQAEGTDHGVNYELAGELLVFNHNDQVAYKRTLPAPYSFMGVSFANKSVVFASGIDAPAASVAAFVSTNAGQSWHTLGVFSAGNGSAADVAAVNANSALFQLLPEGANPPHLLYTIAKVHSKWSLQPISLRLTPTTIAYSPLVSSTSSLHTPLFANTSLSSVPSTSNAKSWLYAGATGGRIARIAPIAELGSGNYQALSAVPGPSNSIVVGGIYFPGSINGARKLFIAHINRGSDRATLVWEKPMTSSYGDPNLVLLSASSWLYGEVNDKRQPVIVYATPSEHISITHTFARLPATVLKSYLFGTPNQPVVSLYAVPGLKHATTTLLYQRYGGGPQAKQYSVSY
jgi:hypothetical protein